MSRRETWGRWLSTSDAALSWAERIARLIVLGIGSGVLSSVAGIAIGFITGNPLSGLVIGVVVGMVILVGFAVRAVRIAAAGAPSQSTIDTVEPQPLPDADARPTPKRVISPASVTKENDPIPLGRIAYLNDVDVSSDVSDFKELPVSKILTDSDWVRNPTEAIKKGRTPVYGNVTFTDCNIYGPAVFVVSKGSFAKTFIRCEWDEGLEAFRPGVRGEHYVGVIGLENCSFRRCYFRGVSFIIAPEDYGRIAGIDRD